MLCLCYYYLFIKKNVKCIGTLFSTEQTSDHHNLQKIRYSAANIAVYKIMSVDS
jgi:hypothetical protein